MVNLAQPQLSGLGRNPAAPVGILVRLAAHQAGRHGLTMREGRLPDAVAEALLAHGGSDSAVLLHRRRVSPAIRRTIAGHPDPAVRNAFADFVQLMVKRGVALGIGDLVEVYGQEPEQLAAAPDVKLRAAVAQAWRDRPMAVQRALLTDPDPRVRAAATRGRHPGVPPEYYERCLADPAVRANIARRLPLSPDQFERLLATGEKDVLDSVAGNPHLSADMVERLRDSASPFVRVAVAYSRHTAPTDRDRLLAMVRAEEAAGSIDAEIALHWSREPDWLRAAPLTERLKHLQSPHTAFRRIVATGRDLPDRSWRLLDEDPDVTVRRTAARRPDTPPQTLLRLLRDHGENPKVRPLLVEHPNFPRQELRGLAHDPNPQTRAHALEDPGLPLPQLRALAACEESFLRAGAARHPGATEDLLEQLLADPDPGVADDAAANPALPPSRMDRIITEAGL
ncbi:hypothetical protein GCM10009760_55510 [Kitasatospora kazusensis]|uniref:Leucine rich repeat (LRR) protein n=1 Tax=Kitasatospora kazusensis TaxID=407974 RepID=A0ABN3A7A8_9ACTN